MGYYTELKAHLVLSSEAPSDILEKLCSGEMWKELAQAKFGKTEVLFSVQEEPELPIDHPFGKSKRWSQIFNQESSYDRDTGILHIDCDIKAYDEIYELLLDWLKPFMLSGTWKTKGEDSGEWFYEKIKNIL